MDASKYDPIRLEELLELQDFGFNKLLRTKIDSQSVQFVNKKDKKCCMVRLDEADKCIQLPTIGNENLFHSVDPTGEITVTGLETEKFQKLHTLVMYNMKTKKTMGVFNQGKSSYHKWISVDTVAVITQKEVFHWSKTGSTVKIFDLSDKMQTANIQDYLIDESGNWHLLVSQARCTIMQLYSVKHTKSKDLFGQQAACFTKYKKSNCGGSLVDVLCINTNTFPHPGLQIALERFPEAAHKIKILELDAAFKLPTLSTILIPVYPHANRDFCIGLHMCEKYGVIFHTTKKGWITLIHMESGVDFYQCGMDILEGTTCNEIAGVNGSGTGEGIMRIAASGSVFKVTLNEDDFDSYLTQKLGLQTTDEAEEKESKE